MLIKNLLIPVFVLFVFLNLVSCDEEVPLISETYSVSLSEVNNSGVSGSALISVDGNQIIISIKAAGLEGNKIHQQHIHGMNNSVENSICPISSADANNDGFIDLSEGSVFFGGALITLEEFPEASANGLISYKDTLFMGQNGIPEFEDLKPLDHRVLILKGMTVDQTYNETIPVACGQIVIKN